MVLKLSLSNFYSIKDTLLIDFEAARISTAATKALSSNIFTLDGKKYLKSIGVFGPNASGKTSIVKALLFCSTLILDSFRNNEGILFNFMPFKFDGYPEKPSSFSINFICDDTEYEYSFSLNRKEIISESLYYYPGKRKAKIFVRNEQVGKPKSEIYSFGEGFFIKPLDVAQSTGRSTLFISRASQMDRELAKRVFRFFCDDVVLDYRFPATVPMEQLLSEQKPKLLEVLRTADSDIVDIQLRGDRIVTYHRNNPDVSFDFETEESEGTKTLFRMMVSMIDIIRQGKTLFVDEIDTSLHTQLVEFIIGMFNSSQCAQLVYTTHNTHLLNTDFQRRDQVYFVNKRDDGSSDLYSLFDYKDFRDTMDMEKAYLQGRFDAIPYLSKAVI